jgi:hypothetical protein
LTGPRSPANSQLYINQTTSTCYVYTRERVCVFRSVT